MNTIDLLSSETIFVPDNFTPVQQEFATFITERVRPIEAFNQRVGGRDYQEAVLDIKPSGLVPITSIELKKWLGVHDRYPKNVIEEYFGYLAVMENKKHSIRASLWLETDQVGFRYTATREGFHKPIADEEAEPIVTALLKTCA